MAIEENEQAPTNPARAKRFKPKRGLGSAVTRKRRLQAEALQEQIDARRKAEQDAARQELERLRRRSTAPVNETDKWQANLLRSVVSNQTAVLRSWGFSQPVQCSLSQGSNVNAYTDFKKIVVNWPKDGWPNRLDRAPVLDLIAQIKGVMQHEMGHIRFTTPFLQVKTHLTGNHPEHTLFKCWNMLEDERMESLVVESVPRIANYFGTMVANVCLLGGNVPLEHTWLMLAGREYLPKPVLRKSYELFDQFCYDQGINDGALTWYQLVQAYKAATTPKALAKATEDAYEFIQLVRATIPESIDNHADMEWADNDVNTKANARKQGSILDLFNENPPKKPTKKGKQSNEPGDADGDDRGGDGSSDGDEEGDEAEGDGSGGSGEGGEEEGDADGEGDGGSAEKKGSKDEPGKGQTSGSGTSETPTEDHDLSDALTEMVDQFQQETRKDGDVLDIARRANTTSDEEGLPTYNGGNEREMDPELVARAQVTALGIEHALNSFVTDSAPIWQNRKERGVIDALAYRTKNTGDRDFRRFLDDHGNQGLNVHVSMLCDVSGSMQGAPIVALSESLYATAQACHHLGIGATFTLWSSGGQNYRVWRDGIPTPTVWPAMGGTDPLTALDDLDGHNPECADNHLIIIFTDGAWASNFPSLQRWSAPGRTFVLVRYGQYDGAMQKDMGADRHIGISNVNQLPEQLTHALIDVLAEGGGW